MRYNIATTSLSGILDLGVQLFRNNARAALTIVLLLSLPDLLVIGVEHMDVNAMLADGSSASLPMAMEGEASPEIDLQTLIIAGISLMQAFLLFPVTSGALVLLFTGDVFGEPITWRAALQRAWASKGSLCTTMALSTLFIILGMLLILPGIYLALRFTLIYHTTMLEGLDPKAAMRRSGVLMKSYYMSALALVFLLWGVTIGVLMAVSSTASPLVAGLVQWVAQAGTLAVVTACYTAMYFSARCKHEQFDLTVSTLRRP